MQIILILDFIYENLMIQNNIINAAFLNGVKKFYFLVQVVFIQRLQISQLMKNLFFPENLNQQMNLMLLLK